MSIPTLTSNPVFEDSRGCFSPFILDKNWVQSNLSISDNIFTFRGLHFQVGEFAQRKKLTVVRGQIIDFCVDLSVDNFGKTYEFSLSPGQSVDIPNHFAHGFLTLRPNTIVNYLVDKEYSKLNENSILWSSVPSIKETVVKYLKGWDIQITISSKDQEAISLSDFYESITNNVR